MHFFPFKPYSFEEEVHHKVWISAMEEEHAMINKNNTWEFVDRPEEKNVIGVK